jgi:hypothetical protein
MLQHVRAAREPTSQIARSDARLIDANAADRVEQHALDASCAAHR